MRFRHAARFALPNCVAVLAVALAYELLVVPGGALADNMGAWAIIALAVGAVTFLLRLSDVVTRVPTWAFAWLGAGWVALACVLVVHALELGRVGLAAGTGVVAALFWLAVHRRLPGWPGAFEPTADTPATERRAAEQDLR